MLTDPIKKLEGKIINKEETLIGALKKMDKESTKMLFVYDGTHFIGILTIGDIQRSIIRNTPLSERVSAILESGKVYAKTSDDTEDIKALMLKERCQYMPVLDENEELVDVMLWEEVFNISPTSNRGPINLPVVIMAGGQGVRLRPLTNVIPKPLIPLKDKTILEAIMDQFEGIGCKQFYLSVNYKSDMIKLYLSQTSHSYNIEYFQEDKPLGTIGSVSLLKDKISTPFFVSNCDILVDQDYRDVYEYHVNNNNDITIVTAVKSNQIPYGVIETGQDGLMTSLKEKPESTYMINTGVYILNPDLIKYIPDGKVFHITDLMNMISSNGGRVGCFPVSENMWKDTGEWAEYLKLINLL